MPCCCEYDEERQCGLYPFKCCDNDNNGMCWGFICCNYQIDPCWGPRQCLHCCCAIVPCGCIAKETIFTIFCCNPGRSSRDPYETQKDIDKAAAAQNAKK